MGYVKYGEPVPPAEDPGIESIKVNTKTGKATVEMSQELLAKAQKSMAFYDDAMVGMQQELDRLNVEEKRARSVHPVLGVVQKLAANMAMQPDQPGFVRALGMTSAQMNPDADVLAARRVPLLQQIAEMQNRQALTEGNLAQVGLNYQARTDAELDRADERAARAEAAKQTSYARAVTTLAGMMGNSILTPKQVRGVLGKDTDDATVEAYIEQSRIAKENADAIREDKKLTNSAKRVELGALADAARANAESRRARAAYDKVRSETLPALMGARVNELDARAEQHRKSGAYSEQRIALDTQRFAHTLEAWESAKAEQKIRLYNEVMGNIMAPDSEKQRLYEDISRLGYSSKVQPPTPAPAPAAPPPGQAPPPAAGQAPPAAAAAIPGLGQPLTGLKPHILAALKEGTPVPFSNGKTLLLMGGNVYDVTHLRGR